MEEIGTGDELPTKTQEAGLEEDMSAFLRCAEMVSPWLNSFELASVSCTCKFLYGISKSITANRVSDASRSMEKHPISFINTEDHHPYADFLYFPSQIVISSKSYEFERQFWGSSSVVGGEASGICRGRLNDDFKSRELTANVNRMYGCDCDNCDELVDGDCLCPCYGFKKSGLVTECGLACRCESLCSNRSTQRGVSVRLKIVRDSRKGWGLHADEKISCGQFICEYAGEVLTTKEARRRQRKYDEVASSKVKYSSSALLVVREYLPSGRACIRLNVDATYIGNVARFINHSCDGGNLSFLLVRSLGVFLPHVCFFAARDIHINEELTFSYGCPELCHTAGPEMLCFCGSSCCRGVLPSEDT